MKMLAGMAVAAAMLLGACATAQEEMAESGKQPLGAAEVRTMLSDTTNYGTTNKGVKWVLYRAPNGEMRGKAMWSGGSDTDTGEWWVKDDGTYCAKYNNWQSGREGCWKIYKEESEGEITFAAVSGRAEDNSFQKDDIVDGNAENL